MLEYIVRQSRGRARATIVMIHGFGSNAHDLFPLADIFDDEGYYDWVFPEAPLVLSEWPDSRVWFPDDPVLQQRALAGHYFDVVSEIDPPGIGAAASAVTQLIQHTTTGKLVVGGFSQGNMVAVEMVANAMIQPQGMLLFSAVLTAVTRWQKGLHSVTPCPFLQSHGRNDQVLYYRDAQKLYQLLCQCNFSGDFHSFEGGHEIPPELTPKVTSFLHTLLA